MKIYSYEQLAGMKVIDLRRVLGGMNVTARKRIKGITGAGYKSDLTPVNVRGLRKGQLIQQILETEKFITGPRGSKTAIRRQERKTIKELNKRGYTFIRHGNIKRFGDFIDMIRGSTNKAEFNRYSLPAAASAFAAAEKANIPPETLNRLFNKYMAKASVQAIEGQTKAAAIETALANIEELASQHKKTEQKRKRKQRSKR